MLTVVILFLTSFFFKKKKGVEPEAKTLTYWKRSGRDPQAQQGGQWQEIAPFVT